MSKKPKVVCFVLQCYKLELMVEQLRSSIEEEMSSGFSDSRLESRLRRRFDRDNSTDTETYLFWHCNKTLLSEHCNDFLSHHWPTRFNDELAFKYACHKCELVIRYHLSKMHAEKSQKNYFNFAIMKAKITKIFLFTGKDLLTWIALITMKNNLLMQH